MYRRTRLGGASVTVSPARIGADAAGVEGRGSARLRCGGVTGRGGGERFVRLLPRRGPAAAAAGVAAAGGAGSSVSGAAAGGERRDARCGAAQQPPPPFGLAPPPPRLARVDGEGSRW